MKITLNYGELNSDKDISKELFQTEEELINAVSSKIYSVEDVVFIFSVSDELIITENKEFIIQVLEKELNSVYPYFEDEQITIFEEESYEDAYKLATDMKEENPLCYSKEKPFNIKIDFNQN